MITDGRGDTGMLLAAHLIGYTYGQKGLPKQLHSLRTLATSYIPLHIRFFIGLANTDKALPYYVPSIHSRS